MDFAGRAWSRGVWAKQTGRVDPERYGASWDVAVLLGLDDIYKLDQKYGVSQVPVA